VVGENGIPSSDYLLHLSAVQFCICDLVVSRVGRGLDEGSVVLANGAPDSPLLSLKEIFPT